MTEFTQEQLDAAVEKAKAGLVTKNDELLGEVKTLKSKMKPFEGLDPEEIKQALADAKTLREEKLKKDGDFEKLREADRKAHLEEKSRWDAEKAEFTKREESAARRAAVMEAVQEAKIAAPFLKTVIPFLEGQVSFLGEGANRRAVVQDKDVKDYLAEFVATDEGKHYVQADMNTGGGAGGGGVPGFKGINPFDKKTLNVTEQMKIAKENPKLADQLKRQASGR